MQQPASDRARRQNRPQPKAELTILAPAETIAALDSASTAETESNSDTTSWSGFLVPTPSSTMAALAGARWADIVSSTPSVCLPSQPAFPADPEGVAPDSDAETEDCTPESPGATTFEEVGKSEEDGHEPFADDEPEAAPMLDSIPPAVPVPTTYTKANYELEGWIGFFPYPEGIRPKGVDAASVRPTSVDANAPIAVGTASGQVVPSGFPYQHQKLFMGHWWGNLPIIKTLDWLVAQFVPPVPNARHVMYAPQPHVKDGWFRGCLHVTTASPRPEAIVGALHRRLLFDLEGVWYAETADEQNVLEEYCRRLRSMPMHQRHAKLQGLPCNPMACEPAANDR